MCMFSIEIQTAGQIRMKFGSEVIIDAGKVLGGFNPVPPPPGTGGPLVGKQTLFNVLSFHKSINAPFEGIK